MLFRSLIDTILIDSQWIPHVTINYVVLLTSVDFYIIITLFWEAERAQMCGICTYRTDTIHNTVLVMNRYCSQTFSRFPMAKTSRLNPSKVSNVNTPADCNRTLMSTGERWFFYANWFFQSLCAACTTHLFFFWWLWYFLLYQHM